MANIVINVVMGSVMLLMIGAGLSISLSEVLKVLRNFQLVTIGVLANFVVFPILAYVTIQVLPLSTEVAIGIMLMAAAPIAPMAPAPFVEVAKGDLPYSVGLMVLAAVLSVPLTPLILSYTLPASSGDVDLSPMQIVETLLKVQLIPICIGMGIRRASTNWADKLLTFVPRIGQVGLVVGVGLILAKQAKDILSIEPLAYLVLIVLVVLSLAIGHWMLVREAPDKRRSLAVLTAIRNVPLAFLIAGENFSDTIVAPVVLMFGVFTMLGSVAYAKLLLRSEPGTADE